MFTEIPDQVDVKHPLYDIAASQRRIYQDVASGVLALRAKGETYMPKFPTETEASYNFRVNTATMLNLTKKTRDVMTGLVHNREIELGADVPGEIKNLWENIDNAGTHGDVFARKCFEDSFEGFSLILVDNPSVIASDLEEQRTLGLRPYWTRYSADQVWNWRYRVNPVSKTLELTLLVLFEPSIEPDGNYKSKTVVRYRVFRLVKNAVQWELYRQTKAPENNMPAEYVREDNGIIERATQIPVGVIGALGDPPPFMDIALKNLELVQTYSDYKNIIHKTCVPMPVRVGYTKQEGDSAISHSGDHLMDIPIGGDFKFAEVAGTSIEATRNSILDIRDDIALMGLSILADKTAQVDITATEALLNNVGETAEIRVMARAEQDCLELCLGHTAELLGLKREQGGSLTLGTAWTQVKLETDLEGNTIPPAEGQAMEMLN